MSRKQLYKEIDANNNINNNNVHPSSRSCFANC